VKKAVGRERPITIEAWLFCPTVTVVEDQADMQQATDDSPCASVLSPELRH